MNIQVSHLAKGIKRPTWDEQHMFRAIHAGVRSSCLKRAVGAVLIKDNREIASGYAGAPPNVESCLELNYCYYDNIAWQDSQNGNGNFDEIRDTYKYLCLAVHGEANALGQCSRFGIPAEGTILYITNYPCPGCVRDFIITNRISEVKVWRDYLSNPILTMDEKRASEELLKKAGIPLSKVELTDERIMEIALLMTKVGLRTDYEFTP